MSEQAPSVAEVMTQFTPDIWWIAFIAGASAWYITAWRRSQRTPTASHHPRWKLVSFHLGLFVLALAVMSPIEYYGNRLLWANFLCFLLLTMIAPPLILLGSPLTLAFRVAGPGTCRALRGIYRHPVIKFVTFPVASGLIFAAATYVWQFSSLTDWAAEHTWVRELQLSTLLLVAFIFWLPALATDPLRWRVPYPFRILYVLVEMTHKGLFGGMFLSMNSPFHDYFVAHAPAWGPSPMMDQRIGILILWIGGNIIFVFTLIGLVVRWMDYERRNDHRVDIRLAAAREAEARRAAALEQVFRKPV
ncbi:MAG: cytochrome c oxidase assembly protein [Hyphomicrobiales bacterium]